ncbi:MAG: flagellar basal body P-ring formation chaperone FlgA [Gammaproteobacteria bacterium]|nr:flagellar basal body P-ring formation chaperone FlgA [Gammaproteobacteria bacterium]
MTVFVRSTRRILGALVLSAIVTGVCAAAGEHHELSAIASAVSDFVRTDHQGDHYPPQIRVGKLDSRLRLRRCAQPLHVTYATGQRKIGRTYASVSCASPVEWRIYVPVIIATFGDVLVARHALPRGHRLSAADVRVEKRELSAFRQGFYSDINKLSLVETKRAIAAGVTLTPDKVAPIKLVRNGEVVHLVSASKHVRVAARGKALSDGAAGHTVRVRNLSSGRIVEGRVIGLGKVAVQ